MAASYIHQSPLIIESWRLKCAVGKSKALANGSLPASNYSYICRPMMYRLYREAQFSLYWRGSAASDFMRSINGLEVIFSEMMQTDGLYICNGLFRSKAKGIANNSEEAIHL